MAGKWNGKGGKDGAASDTGVKGHELPRVRITAEKFVGTVVGWRGKYGWIKAAEAIDHEKAALRGGKLFAGNEDIIGKSALDEGAEVEFHIFEDDSGLGAEEIVQTGEGKPGKAAGKSAGKKGAPWGEAFGTKGVSKGGPKGWDAALLAKALSLVQGKGWGKGGVGKGEGKGKGKGKKGRTGGGEGHLLPRTRISAEKFSGTVSGWRGKYGWITPAEPIEHEKASLHRGDLFVSINDLEGGLESLTPEAAVEFHIAEDSSGLCAEEVAQV